MHVARCFRIIQHSTLVLYPQAAHQTPHNFERIVHLLGRPIAIAGKSAVCTQYHFANELGACDFKQPVGSDSCRRA